MYSSSKLISRAEDTREGGDIRAEQLVLTLVNLCDIGCEQDCNVKDARKASMCGRLTETVKGCKTGRWSLCRTVRTVETPRLRGDMQADGVRWSSAVIGAHFDVSILRRIGICT
jgi:hypothetical protein